MLTRRGRPAISIIVPVYCERSIVPDLVATLEPFFGLHELIIVDGASTDGTYETLAERDVARVIRSSRGRAVQMNAGARVATGHMLLFLHADTSLEPECPELALAALDRGADGGCFSIRIKSQHRRLKVSAAMQTARSRMFASATGDQAIFVRRDVFEALGGYDESKCLCEDIDLVSRFVQARGRRRFVCLSESVETSGRRWEQSGITRTMLLMWGLRTAYHLGAPTSSLAKLYQAVR